MLATQAWTFGGATIQVECTPGRAAELATFVFHRIARQRLAATPQVVLRLLENPADGAFTLSSRGEVRCVDKSAGTIASWLLHVTCRQLAETCRPGLLLHGGLVRSEADGVVLAGASGSGKTTLSAFLSSKNFDHITDELVYLPPASMRVAGFSAPLKLKKHGLAPLQGRIPLSPDSGRVLVGRHDVLVHLASRRRSATVRLSAIVFPQYKARARFRLERLSSAQAGLRLMAGVLNAGELPDHGFREVARLAGRVPAYDLRYSSLKQLDVHLGELRRALTPPVKKRAKR